MKNKAIIKKFAIGLTIAILFIGIYYMVGKHYVPAIHLNDGTVLTQEQESSIIAAEQGYYNKYLPIFAEKITVLQSDDDKVLWQVDYFPFGRIERSLNRTANGEWLFNLEN